MSADEPDDSRSPAAAPDSEAPSTSGSPQPDVCDAVSAQRGAPSAAVVPASDLCERLDRLEQTLQTITQAFQQRLRYDEAKEVAFNRLYAELDEQRRKLANEPVKPILRDLILLYDHVVEAIRSPGEGVAAIEFIQAGLLEVLSRANVDPIEVTESRFDRSQQCVARVERTAEPAQDWMVVEVLKQGFRLGDVVLRPQHVVVQRFQQPGDNATPNCGLVS
jgi:molecular chaperone GrpE